MQDGLLDYVKVSKKNELKRINCLVQISKTWGIK